MKRNGVDNMEQIKNANGDTVLGLSDDTVAILKRNIVTREISVQINQLDPLDNDPFKYTSVYVDADALIELGEHLKKLRG